MRNRKIWLTAVVIALVAVMSFSLAACNDDDNKKPIVTMTISDTSKTLTVGDDAYTLTAEVYADNVKKTDAVITWTSSNPSAVTLSATTGGSVSITPVAAGQSTITATSGGVSKTCVVSVTEAAVEYTTYKITVNFEQAIGEGDLYTYYIYDYAKADGNWTSANDNAGTVSNERKTFVYEISVSELVVDKGQLTFSLTLNKDTNWTNVIVAYVITLEEGKTEYTINYDNAHYTATVNVKTDAADSYADMAVVFYTADNEESVIEFTETAVADGEKFKTTASGAVLNGSTSYKLFANYGKDTETMIKEETDYAGAATVNIDLSTTGINYTDITSIVGDAGFEATSDWSINSSAWTAEGFSTEWLYKSDHYAGSNSVQWATGGDQTNAVNGTAASLTQTVDNTDAFAVGDSIKLSIWVNGGVSGFDDFNIIIGNQKINALSKITTDWSWVEVEIEVVLTADDIDENGNLLIGFSATPNSDSSYLSIDALSLYLG